MSPIPTKHLELAVVMPIYNEAAIIEAVVSEWVAELDRLGITFVLLAINDGSLDDSGIHLQTLAERHPGVVTPIEKRNAGHGQACRTGYLLAVEQGADWTFQIDADGQCDPRFFSLFWNGRDQADAIFGLRTTRDDGFMRALVSAGCRLATSLRCGIDLQDVNVPYRLIRTSALKDALARIPDDFDMQNVALTLALKRNVRLRWKHIPIHFRNRQGGAASINFRRMMGMAWELLVNLHKIGR